MEAVALWMGLLWSFVSSAEMKTAKSPNLFRRSCIPSRPELFSLSKPFCSFTAPKLASSSAASFLPAFRSMPRSGVSMSSFVKRISVTR